MIFSKKAHVRHYLLYIFVLTFVMTLIPSAVQAGPNSLARVFTSTDYKAVCGQVYGGSGYTYNVASGPDSTSLKMTFFYCHGGTYGLTAAPVIGENVTKYCKSLGYAQGKRHQYAPTWWKPWIKVTIIGCIK